MKFEPLFLQILGDPVAKQSTRFKNVNTKDGRNFTMTFTDADIANALNNQQAQMVMQLPESFHIITDGPVEVKYEFIFSIPKGFSKKRRLEIEQGKIVYKTTKPDTDNLIKGIKDKMKGVVFTDDSIVAQEQIRKIYGPVPQINLLIRSLE